MMPFWKARRVLVTGATGMVGSWLVKDLLSGGAHVIALVLDEDPQSELLRSGDLLRVTVVNGTLEDFRTVERAINGHEVDTVFHLGAQAVVGVAKRAPLATFESNIRGSYHVLEACRLHSDLVQAVVIASSDKAYGKAIRLPYTEDMPLAGRDPYEVSKSCTDLLAQAYHRTYGLPVGIARCGNIYGGGDLNWSRLVPGTIRSFLRRERPVVRSDGSYVRDFLYVRDATSAYMRLAERLRDERVRGEAFNFSTETPRTVMDLVTVIQKLMECGDLDPVVRDSAGGEIHSQYLSAAKARAILDWEPGFDLETGIKQTIGWYHAFISGCRS